MSSKAPSGSIIEVSSQDTFDKLVVNNTSSLVVAYFTAAWCGPCRAMQPVLDSLATKHQGQVSIVKVDIDNEGVNKVVQAHNITGVPTYCFYKGGKMVDSFTGARKDLLEKTIDKLK